jgi:hypothetical protein
VSAQHTRATASLQRRFERWELEHLRVLAADLAARLEETERRLAGAEDRADFWHDQAIEMHNQAADDAGGMPGLTMGGQLVIVPAIEGGLHA